MKAFFLCIGFALSLFSADYLTNKSCQECHPDIYDEYQSSWHSKTWFNDTLHREVGKKIPVYDCGRCHMPAAKNLTEMEAGKTTPNPIHKEQKDAISCFYCHQIAYVKQSHRFNENTLARQAAGYKPTLYGSLENPDDSDKHAMVKSPIYDKYACMGCHGHKRNGNDVLIFQAMKEGQDSKECIKCHMPYIDGPVEKMNKRSRSKHRSHYFAGIRDSEMREKGLGIDIEAEGDTLKVTIENKMGHPLIIQPARMKYLSLKVVRDGKVIWKNYEKSPREDKQGTFVTDFADADGKPVAIPYFAKKRAFVNNIEAKSEKTLTYKVPTLHKDDRIVAEMYVLPAKPDCAAAVSLDDDSFTQPLLMKRVEKTIQ
jgi:nitrate/TMAO reductase-like tetraheme cytochrome c subunit